MDLDKVRVKERIAEEHYDEFNRNYRSKNYQEASLTLYECVKSLVCALAMFKEEELKSDEEIMNFLNQMQEAGDISQEEITIIKYIRVNGLRGTMDERMFEIYKEKTDRIIAKLKRILRDKLVDL